MDGVAVTEVEVCMNEKVEQHSLEHTTCGQWHTVPCLCLDPNFCLS